jgi:hypothetical protein
MLSYLFLLPIRKKLIIWLRIFSMFLTLKSVFFRKEFGIPEKNSEFIPLNSLSSNILAINFTNYFNEGKIKLDTFDKTYQTTINNLFSEIKLL